MAIGQLRGCVRLDQRAVDDNGDRMGAFAPVATVSARVQYLRGGEEVLAQRLTSVQPVVVRVRATPVTEAVTPVEWQVFDVDSEQAFDIASVTPDERGQYIDLLCKTGAAA